MWRTLIYAISTLFILPARRVRRLTPTLARLPQSRRASTGDFFHPLRLATVWGRNTSSGVGHDKLLDKVLRRAGLSWWELGLGPSLIVGH